MATITIEKETFVDTISKALVLVFSCHRPPRGREDLSFAYMNGAFGEKTRP